jgi:hypothetical protein
MGFDLQRLKNPAAVVHSTLKRMAEKELFYDQHSKTNQLFAKWDLDDPNNPLYTSGMREFPGKKK